MNLNDNKFWWLGDLHKKDEKYAHDLVYNFYRSEYDEWECLQDFRRFRQVAKLHSGQTFKCRNGFRT